MGTITSTGIMTFLREPANFDEVSMQQILLSDSLKDLNNLRKQLYSAAEYFELSYTNEDQKQIVGNTLKDYAIEALVNTVDHLGSVTFKVNDLLDGKVDEVTEIELRVSCVEQRLQTCQQKINQEGLLQQSLIINTPKHHKRYILPEFVSVGDTIEGTNLSNLKYQGCSLDEDDWHQYKNAVQAQIRESPPSAARKGCSPTHPPHLQHSREFSFSRTMPKKELEDRRTVSPHRLQLIRTSSIANRPSTPKSSRPSTPNPRPTTPNPSNRRRFPEQPRKSASMRLNLDNITTRDTAQNPSKGKRLLKALLGRRKSRIDGMLNSYLDEY